MNDALTDSLLAATFTVFGIAAAQSPQTPGPFAPSDVVTVPPEADSRPETGIAA